MLPSWPQACITVAFHTAQVFASILSEANGNRWFRHEGRHVGACIRTVGPLPFAGTPKLTHSVRQFEDFALSFIDPLDNPVLTGAGGHSKPS